MHPKDKMVHHHSWLGYLQWLHQHACFVLNGFGDVSFCLDPLEVMPVQVLWPNSSRQLRTSQPVTRSLQWDGEENHKDRSVKSRGLRWRQVNKLKKETKKNKPQKNKRWKKPSWRMPSQSLSNGSPVKIASLPVFNAEHDVIWHGISLWSAWVSCLSSVPSQLAHPHLLADVAEWQIEQALALCKHSPATTETSLCYQHCFGHKSKTQLHMSYYEDDLFGSRGFIRFQTIYLVPAKTSTISIPYSILFTSCSGSTLSNTSSLPTTSLNLWATPVKCP